MATFVQFISTINSAKQQSVFWHNQTKGVGSYSMHKTLNGFYDSVTGLLDGLVESVAGIYGRPQGYEAHDFENFESKEQVIAYFKELYTYIETERKTIYQESWVQNQVDGLSELVASTLYLLTFE